MGEPLKGTLRLRGSWTSAGLDTEGASLRSEGGDSAKDSSWVLRKLELAPNRKGRDDSEVFGRRMGTLLEDKFLRMPGLMGLKDLRLQIHLVRQAL